MLRAITGMLKINVLLIHQFESGLPESLLFKAMITVPNAASPLNRAIKKAIRPRLTQPSTDTGNAALIKNNAVSTVGRTA